MKKLFLFFGLASVLVLGACGQKDEKTASASNENSKSVAKVQKEKDNELVFEADGKMVSIPARIEKNQGDVKEIKIPENTDEVIINKENNGVIIKTMQSTIYTYIQKGRSFKGAKSSLERSLPLEESGKETPVEVIDLSSNSLLKDFDFAIRADLSNTKDIYLLKEIGEKEIIKTKIEIPNDSFNERTLNALYKVATTIKY